MELSFNDGVNHLRARLYRPPGFDASSNQWPLVMFLHGVGENGTDNVTQVSYHIEGLINATKGTNFASFLLAPQLPVGADWRQTQWRTLTLAALQSVQTNYLVDSRRLYLTGLSLGAIGIYDDLPLRPDLFAAAVPMAYGDGDEATLIGRPSNFRSGGFDLPGDRHRQYGTKSSADRSSWCVLKKSARPCQASRATVETG